MKNTILLFFLISIIMSSCGPNKEKAQILIEKGIENIYNAKHTEALTNFNEALEYDPDSYEAYYYRGSCKQNLNKYDEAIIDYRNSIDIKPDFAEAYFNLALIYDFRQEKDSACFYYLKAEELGKPNIGDYTKRCK